MGRILPALILLFSASPSACANSAITVSESPAINQAGSQKANTDDKRNRELEGRLAQIASGSGGRVGVKAVLLETGEAVSLNPNDRFPMQSVYKLPIGMAVLNQVDAGKIKLDQRVRVRKSDMLRQGQHSPIRDKNPDGVELSVAELLRFAVSESDGTASDVLLRLVGGTEAVGKYLNEIKVSEIIVANSEKEIGQDWQTQYRNWASPEGAAALLRALLEGRGLSTESQALLLRFMTESKTYPDRLKGLLPKDAIVAHKTGSSGAQNGVAAATNDIGIVTLPNGQHIAIAVFVSDSTADDARRARVIAEIAKAVWDRWSS